MIFLYFFLFGIILVLGVIIGSNCSVKRMMEEDEIYSRPFFDDELKESIENLFDSLLKFFVD